MYIDDYIIQASIHAHTSEISKLSLEEIVGLFCCSDDITWIHNHTTLISMIEMT